MSSNPSRPVPRSWKHAVNAPVSRRRAGPQWKREELPPPRPRGWRGRSLRVALLGLAFALCLGLLVWVFLWLWPARQVAVVLVGASYAENLAVPPNVYGWQGLNDLAAAAGQPAADGTPGLGLLRARGGPRQLRVGDAWDKDLDGAPERTVVVFLALHGGVDARGAYLVPDDAGLGPTAENRLRLEDVLDRLARLPAARHKVLILDATQMSANWPLGMLQNDFARELEGLDERIAAVPNLVVLSSSAPDQLSWSSPEWRQTAFTHFLIEGLRGRAGDLNRDNRLSLGELFHYVRANVETWVWFNRQDWQTPVLLPSGELGERRAAAIDVAYVPGGPAPAAPAPPAAAPFQAPAELRAAWQHYQVLAAEVPAPEAYTPGLWREYQRVLLRYEQLLRAGAPQAAKVAGHLPDLELQIRQAQGLELRGLSSAQTSLAMEAAGGALAAPPPATREQFDRLWNATPPDDAKRWAEMQNAGKSQDRLTRQRLRAHFYQLLLEHAAQDPPASFRRAFRLAQVLAEPAGLAPAEVHQLVMLARDLPEGPPPADLLQQALRLIVLAQQTALAVGPGAYAYSEQVYPWVQAKVTAADQQRRIGQDLLFASGGQDWARARAALDRAEEGYRAARADGDVVREALATRDRVLAQLPYYSHWLARRRYVGEGPGAGGADPLAAAEQLWQETHQLAHLLDLPNPTVVTTAAPPRQPRSLRAQAELVRQRYEDLERRFFQYALGLGDAGTQAVLRDIEAVLEVPLPATTRQPLETTLRLQLLDNLCRMSHRLLVETTGGGVLPALDYEAIRRAARQDGGRQGRMAIASLGAGWFDECVAGEETFAQAQHRLATYVVDPRWWRSLARVGGQVGLCCRRMTPAIRDAVTRPPADRGQALAALRKAALLTRQLDAAQVPLLRGLPADQLRRLELSGLLVWQGERTLEDHWFAEDPAAPPYYASAGALFAADARRLGPRPPSAALQALERRLAQPGDLTLTGLARYAVTTDQPFAFDYRLQPAPDAFVPAGLPVVWAEAADPNKVRVLSPTYRARLVRIVGEPAGGPPDATRVACNLASPLVRQADANPPDVPAVVPATVTVRGLYRGQRLEKPTRLDLYPLADTIVYRQPLPRTGSVTVRGERDELAQFGLSTGSLAIVLDCSGSMGPPEGQAWGPTTKYNEALAALREILGRLPKGTTVSLWVFGQAVGPAKTVDDAESTIRRIQAPVVWGPDDPDQLRGLMARLAYPALEPWNESPIVRAIVAAKEDLRRAGGFKSVLVLTDGMDNRFARDRELNPRNLDIPAFLTETFRNTGIALNVVGYKVSTAEARAAEEQFRVVTQLTPPGRFVTVDDARRLAAVLDDSLRPVLPYQVDREDNVPVLPAGAGEPLVTPFGGNAQWFPGGLNPALYQLRVQADRRIQKTIAVQRGDLLLVDFVPTGRGFRLERGSYWRSEYPWKPSRAKSGWRLAVLQDQLVGAGGLEMLATLEKEPDPREDTLQMLKPRWTWLELGPAAAGAPYSVRWGYRASYPAPAWALSVPRWPGRPGSPELERPVLRAWWDPDQETGPPEALDRGPDFRTPADLVNRRLLVDGDEVTVRSVRVEQHTVSRAGVRETVSCLVVRLTHPPGRPVWVRLSGLTPRGQEQRFYTAIGHSTALFWPITEEEANQGLAGLSFYSVNAFKARARARGFYVELDGLAPPAPGDLRPGPPVSLR
jgi:hypothetical protein